MSHCMIKPTMWVLTRSGTKNGMFSHRNRLEAPNFVFLKTKRGCIMCVAKTKTLISCAVTAQMKGVFVFAYECCWFS